MIKKLVRYIRLKFIGRERWVRSIYWSIVFKSFGKKSFILGPLTVKEPENIAVGNNTVINQSCVLNGRGGITIGNSVSISVGVIINSGGLDLTDWPDTRKHHNAPVHINNRAWIASGAIINPGVTIGKNSIVGAGSVVTKDVPDNSLVVGSPAKVIRSFE